MENYRKKWQKNQDETKGEFERVGRRVIGRKDRRIRKKTKGALINVAWRIIGRKGRRIRTKKKENLKKLD